MTAGGSIRLRVRPTTCGCRPSALSQKLEWRLVLRASRGKDWRPLEKITAEEWLLAGRAARPTRHFGAAATSQAWRSARAGAAALIWANIDRLYAARHAGMKQDLFGYVPGGLARVLDRLARTRRPGCRCADIEQYPLGHESSRRVSVETAGSVETHDAAVVTTPSPIATRLVPQMRPRSGKRTRPSCTRVSCACRSFSTGPSAATT